MPSCILRRVVTPALHIPAIPSADLEEGVRDFAQRADLRRLHERSEGITTRAGCVFQGCQGLVSAIVVAVLEAIQAA